MQCHTFVQKKWAFETPLPLGILVNLPWGGHGHVLELHIVNVNKIFAAICWIKHQEESAKLWVYLYVRTWELFLCFVAIVRVRVYYIDFFVFFVLRHW